MNEDQSRCKKALSEWIMLSLHVSMRSQFRYFKQKGLSHSQIFTLHLLTRKKQCTVGDVSTLMSISNPAASQLLDNLVNMGVIERYESSEDRRVRLHKLTGMGKMMMQQSHSLKKDWQKELVEGMTEEELRTTADVLELLNSKLRVHDGQAVKHIKHMHGDFR